MDITVEQLLSGKATRIKEKAYFPTKAYVEPFLDYMSKFTNDFKVKVELPDQITRTVNGSFSTDDITYNRVWIQAVMPETYAWDNHDEVIGLVYGLDARKPVAKLYRGALNRACTNLCVFSPQFLNVQELKEETPINFSPIKNLMELTSDLKQWLENLKSTNWDRDISTIEQKLGKWTINSLHSQYGEGTGKVKLGHGLVLDAYKSLFENTKSEYFIPENQAVNMFTVYNAFTDLITNDNDKDILNKCEKTLLLRQILEF